MDIAELERRLAGTSRKDDLTAKEMRRHFSERGPLTTYQGREVYLFEAGRSFGSRNHAVEFHGMLSPFTPEHIYSYAMITYVYSGTFSMRVADVPVELSAGDCIVLDRHVPHSVEPTGPDDVTINFILADEFFSSEMVSCLTEQASSFASRLSMHGAPHDDWRVYRTAKDGTARDYVVRILSEHFEPDTASGYIEEFLLAALLTHLIRTYEPREEPDGEAFEQSELIGAVKGYLERHYQEGNLAIMAQDLGYERTYLSKAIRAGTGSTFKQLVNAERMRHAALLLRSTTTPVYEVAKEVGLSNLTAFYKRFREWAGCTPQEYRDKNS